MPESDAGEIAFESPSMRAGFTVLPNWLIGLPGISDGAWRLYVTLLSYAWGKERCWPGQATLAAVLHTGQRTIRYRVTELEAAGLVSVVRRGLNRTNLYLIKSWDQHPAAVRERQEVATPPNRQVSAAPKRRVPADQERQGVADMKNTQGETPNEEGKASRHANAWERSKFAYLYDR